MSVNPPRDTRTAARRSGGSKPRRQYRSREERRREISEATLEILAELGPAAWTTAILAERVGVAEATLFKHFDSKADILVTAVTRQENRTQAWIRSWETAASGWDAFQGFLEALVEHAVEHGGGPLVLLEHATRFPPELMDLLRETHVLMTERLEGFLSDSELEPVAPILAGIGLSIATRTLLTWSMEQRSPEPLRRMHRQLELLGRAFRSADPAALRELDA